MAVDTENKRRSIQAYTLGLLRPVADATISVGDRAMLTWLYASEFSPEPPSGELTYMYSRTRRMNHRLIVRA
jgi:hypothetical protein